MRKALPTCLGWGRFILVWKPDDLVLTSRLKIRNRAQELLFIRHKNNFPNELAPIIYRPTDSRKQNIMVTIPGSNFKQRKLVLNDVVKVPVQYTQEVIDGKWGKDWALGYAMTVHSSQGLTIHNPKKSGLLTIFFSGRI